MKMNSMEIKAFIKRHSFVSLAIGFLLAHTGAKFLESIVEGVIMPLFNPLLGGVDWNIHYLNVGPFSFLWGPIVSDGIHLLAVIIIVVITIRTFHPDEADSS